MLEEQVLERHLEQSQLEEPCSREVFLQDNINKALFKQKESLKHLTEVTKEKVILHLQVLVIFPAHKYFSFVKPFEAYIK